MNWRARLLNKPFWVALIPAVLILSQTIAALFGYQWDVDWLSAKLLELVNAIFAVLIIMGVVVDPTTQGLGDEKTDTKERDE